MKTIKDKTKIIRILAPIAVVLICTIVTSYGLLSAPESDEDILKKELAKNSEALLETEPLPSETASVEDTSVPTEVPTEPDEITVIGDSIFLNAALEFKKLQKNTIIDAKISRQVSQAQTVAKELDSEDKLGNIVIISLGTNGPFNLKTGEALLDYLGTDRQIFWINAFSWKEELPESINQNIQKLCDQYENLTVIPWSDEGSKHPEWFYQDGTHLNPEGEKGFAKFVNSYLPSE